MARLRDNVRFARNVMKKFSGDKIRAHAAESAFFIIMSVFPFLMLLLTLLKFTSISAEDIITAIEDLTPFEIRETIEPIIYGIYNQNIVLISGTVVAAIWAAGRSVLGLTDGFNAIYRVEKSRNYFTVRIRSAAYTLVLIVALGISLMILALGYGARNYLAEKIFVLQYIPYFGSVMTALITMVILAFLFLLMYIFLPNKKMRASTQIPGAIFASVAWCAFSYGFSFFLKISKNMSVIYGSLSTLVFAMLWLYACMYLIFIGAEINHYCMAPELFSPDVNAPWDR